MATNYIYRFCQDGDASDVLSDSEYQSDSDRTIGHQPGIARAELANKVGRDASAVASMIGEFTANRQSQNFSSNSDTSDLVSFFVEALRSVIEDSDEKKYPVGRVYISLESTNPGSFLPGTWTRITEGFLYPVGAPSSGSVGHTGGETEVSLSNDNNGPHHHQQRGTTLVDRNNPHDNYINYQGGGDNTFYIKYEAQTNDVGKGKPHNNMPPYLTVFMWKRTS